MSEASCCEFAYFCPTSGATECAEHGGFDVCCAAPELHLVASTDPLVADLVAWLRGGGDSPASDDVARTTTKIARLSAVIVAARAVAAVDLDIHQRCCDVLAPVRALSLALLATDATDAPPFPGGRY